jgi:hypothetical protein
MYKYIAVLLCCVVYWKCVVCLLRSGCWVTNLHTDVTRMVEKYISNFGGETDHLEGVGLVVGITLK